jgi:hypothetical protein
MIRRYAAADLRRHDIPSHLETVVLKPSSEAAYLSRFKQCCADHPEEARHGAKAIEYYRQFVTNIFHRRITADLKAEAALDVVLSPYGPARRPHSAPPAKPTKSAGATRPAEASGGGYGSLTDIE